MDLEQKLEALLKLLANKEQVFDKERQSWRQKERQLMQTIRDLKCSAITKPKP